MTHPDARLPRAVGRRIGFADVPARVQAWVAAEFGAARVVIEHRGGMSPGCATTLATSRGDVFVKAVGAALNAQTPTLFRREIATLAQLPDVTYRPRLLGSYDDGEWVALALEHVPGRYPDVSAEADFAAVADAVEQQSAELTPAPAGVDVPPLAVTAERWRSRWSAVQADPRRYLPGWAADRMDELLPLVTGLADRLTDESLCHFDVRDDNLLIRPDGTAVILDWGMARRGPSWTDRALLAVQKPTADQAQHRLERWVPADAQDVLTALLVAFAGSQAWHARQSPPPSLPALAAFAGADAQRLFAIARLRLPA